MNQYIVFHENMHCTLLDLGIIRNIGYRICGKQYTGINSLCQQIYEELPGWQTPISDIPDFAQLPLQARQYLARLEELIACPISVISVGMRREQTIFKSPVW